VRRGLAVMGAGGEAQDSNGSVGAYDYKSEYLRMEVQHQAKRSGTVGRTELFSPSQHGIGKH